jgi:DNA repair exonuclease SbcCD ATPase subunit
MPIAKRSVTVRIPNELYDMCNKNYDSISNAVIAGLELLFVTNCNNDVIPISGLQAQVEEKEKTIKELANKNENLIKEIIDLKLREPDNKEIQQLQEIRITELQANNQERVSDLKAQVQNLQDQLKTKDEQIDKKDSQIKNLTTITESQVNQRPVKMIEAPGSKKPWWRFW